MEERYNKLSNFLKEKFEEKVLKICIDGGFTCPNRDGRVSYGGCIFCSEKGSGEHLSSDENISKQVNDFFNSYKAKRANKFIVYFQNFSNTYDTVENLKKKYDAALINDRIVGLAVATRPDCINEDVAKLLAEYSKNYYVWIELGLQTSNEKTGKFINRGYDNKTFLNAVSLLRNYGIDVVVHIMVGLPNEDFEDLKNTIKFINNIDVQGIKIHSTYVIKGTYLAKMYENGEYTPLTYNQYMDYLCYIITHLRPDIVIHRISGDAPKELLIAPSWDIHKKWVMNGLFKRMNAEDLWQGGIRGRSLKSLKLGIWGRTFIYFI